MDQQLQRARHLELLRNPRANTRSRGGPSCVRGGRIKGAQTQSLPQPGRVCPSLLTLRPSRLSFIWGNSESALVPWPLDTGRGSFADLTPRRVHRKGKDTRNLGGPCTLKGYLSSLWHILYHPFSQASSRSHCFVAQHRYQ